MCVYVCVCVCVQEHASRMKSVDVYVCVCPDARRAIAHKRCRPKKKMFIHVREVYSHRRVGSHHTVQHEHTHTHTHTHTHKHISPSMGDQYNNILYKLYIYHNHIVD